MAQTKATLEQENKKLKRENHKLHFVANETSEGFEAIRKAWLEEQNKAKGLSKQLAAAKLEVDRLRQMGTVQITAGHINKAVKEAAAVLRKMLKADGR